MKTFIVTQTGSCTAYVTREITVQAESAEEAKEKVALNGYRNLPYTEEFDKDDDYSTTKSVKEYT